MNDVIRSQNGYSVLDPSEYVRWILPLKEGSPKYFTLRPGHAGFLLTHLALFFHEEVEPLNTQAVWDDWGLAVRNVRDSNDVSNHASGTAVDLNATLHPLGRHNTFSKEQITAVHKRLDFMKRTIRWGQDYTGRIDGMHFEIIEDWDTVTQVAKRLQSTWRGKRIIKANPHYNLG